MKTFHCTHCQNLVFFENDRCLKCGYPLAYLADQSMMVALEQGQLVLAGDGQAPADLFAVEPAVAGSEEDRGSAIGAAI
jgi:hypothetical protein